MTQFCISPTARMFDIFNNAALRCRAGKRRRQFRQSPVWSGRGRPRTRGVHDALTVNPHGRGETPAHSGHTWTAVARYASSMRDARTPRAHVNNAALRSLPMFRSNRRDRRIWTFGSPHPDRDRHPDDTERDAQRRIPRTVAQRHLNAPRRNGDALAYGCIIR